MKIKYNLTFVICLLMQQSGYTQEAPSGYADLVRKADSLYDAKDYKASATTYTKAFKVFGWRGYITDRYNAACSWALAGNADSAFFNLERIAFKGNYTSYSHITTDTDLEFLHSDKRWEPLLQQIKANKEKEEKGLLMPLVRELDTIFNDDQKYRRMIGDYQKKYANDSKEMQDFFQTIHEKDSINLVKVKAIIDRYGWLGADSIGQQGNSTLFLVIQHSDLGTQEKYLPLMKEAVKNDKASAADLALLIDRVEMGNNRPQIYGSQLTMKGGEPAFHPILDEANVNKRRKEVGLEPLEDYARRFGIEYKIPRQ
jgi:hypothetical protein